MWKADYYSHQLIKLSGIVFLDKALFTTFLCNIPPSPSLADESTTDDGSMLDLPAFQISLPALLETLQIFGASDTNVSRFSRSDPDGYTSNIRPQRPNAFSNAALGMLGLCRISYPSIGAPFSIILEDPGVTTTCNLNTYEPEAPDEIPLARDRIKIKIIMASRWLHDAVQELTSTSSTRLDITATPQAPYLTLSAAGPLGSASVEFAKGRDLLETFTVAQRWSQSYKFDMIKTASEAMRLASKVSVRGDEQGVLSLQFMVEAEGGSVNFIDFRSVPYVRDEDDEEEDEEGDEDEDERDEVGGEDCDYTHADAQDYDEGRSA